MEGMGIKVMLLCGLGGGIDRLGGWEGLRRSWVLVLFDG